MRDEDVVGAPSASTFVLNAKIAQLTAELAAARKDTARLGDCTCRCDRHCACRSSDTARLDWLEAHRYMVYHLRDMRQHAFIGEDGVLGTRDTLREAIDATMEAK